ncbi:MAG TPA: hypothetical protein VHE12_13310 [bacterium]|nr:hypothetical protein [bacterium]
MAIKSKTTIILGAGASYPYGFPLGTELLKQIIELKGNSDFLSKLETAFPGPMGKTSKPSAQEEYQELTDLLERSGLQSIDAFMVAQPKMAEKSKFAIAYLLLHCEEKNPNVNAEKNRGDWYRYLYNEYLSGASAPSIKAIIDNEVRFITFNYDVSLERFFFNALDSKFGRSDALLFFKSIPIKHIHGKIRILPWEAGTTAADFLFHLDTAKIKEYSQGINYVHENKNDSSMDATRALLTDSENIVFLGFGYDQRNVEILRVDWHRANTHFYGTFFGMEEGEVEKKLRLVGVKNGGNFTCGKTDDDSFVFLKKIANKIN